MKFNFFKIISVCLITPNFITSSPFASLARTPRNLYALQLIARNQLNNHPQRMGVRHMATGVEVIALTTFIAEVAPAVAVAAPCVAVAGGVCYFTYQMFYEALGRLPTAAEMELAKLAKEAQENKQLWEKAFKLARKTGEHEKIIYERLLFSEAQKKAWESEKAMQGYEYDLKIKAQKELNQMHKNDWKIHEAREAEKKAQQKIVATQPIKQTACETATISAPPQQTHTGLAVTQPNQPTILSIPIAEQPKSAINETIIISPPSVPTYTGNINPVPLLEDTGCKFPILEQPKSTAICEIPIVKQPESTAICEIPLVEGDRSLILEKEIERNAQAPGMPTENDGYKPPKKWDGEKVKAKNGRGYGYPDKDGNIWIPTGPGPLAHGGPHWDVQSADGKSYRNIMPGGHVRGQKSKD